MPNTTFSPAQDVPKKGALLSWWLAIRPRTLLISLGPILIGTALASSDAGQMNWLLSIFTLFAALAIQIGTNLMNDVLDYRHAKDKVDKIHLQRAKYLDANQFFLGGCVSFSLALLFGIPLMVVGGWPLVVILLLSIACGYLYTGGPFPFAYVGISNLFILLFFGCVLTVATYYLQTGFLSMRALLAGVQIGFLSIVPHAINNLRDRVDDAVVNKKTLVVRFGEQFGRWEITFCTLFPYVLGLYWIVQGDLWMALLPCLALPLMIRNLREIWNHQPSDSFNQNLAISALCQTLFASLMAFGHLIG
jgi:1,4-dihydroxy-2-naphthoate octaprenyltransferase